MTEKLKKITEEFIQHYFQFNPVNATSSGYAGYDDRWPDFSKTAIQKTIKTFEKILDQSKQIKTTGLNQEIDLNLLQRLIQTELFWLTSAQHYRINPSVYVHSISTGFFSLMMQTHLSEEKRTHYIMSRLNKIQHFTQQAQTNLEKPVTLWTEISLKEIPGTIHYLDSTIANYLAEQKVIGYQKLIDQAKQALFSLQHHLENRPSTLDNFAIGKDNFEYLLKTLHGISQSANDIRETGLQQIELLNNKLNQLAHQIEPEKKWTEVIQFLKNNHPTEEDLLIAYQDKVNEIKKFLTDHDLVSLPKTESLKIISTPKFFQDSIPYAAYVPPAMFSKEAQGLFFVSPVKGNQDLLKEHCHASFPQTALHEAYPGHHLQFATQRELTSPIRKIYNVSSYYEGWTHYCEQMMNRAGFYDQGMQLYQLKDRLWRAARVVVDVSMQCFGMTDSEAAQFMVDQAKLSPAGARVDVNWYTQSPTVPMSYMIGMLEVDQMQKDYTAQGKSLKEFHDAFLSTGAIPLSEVRRLIFD